MDASLPSDHPLRRLFSGAVQHALYVDVGLCDPQIVDYLTDLLASHVHMDEFFPFKDVTGRRLEDLAVMAAGAHFDQAVSPAARQRLVHRYVGDVTLFWAGLFPEGLRKVRPAGLGDRLSDLMAKGKRSYAIASDLTEPEDRPPATVLRRLSDRFEYCVHGLNLCRRDWLTMQQASPGQ